MRRVLQFFGKVMFALTPECHRRLIASLPGVHATVALLQGAAISEP